ncbi:hypothetical protein KEM48_005739 [Puccinia striiformis f. sp. tritici PST-130]|nr:hypothetical protein KEM48_005739 [Puccinia striiformis f. sp. tritici PST-130]
MATKSQEAIPRKHASTKSRWRQSLSFTIRRAIGWGVQKLEAKHEGDVESGTKGNPGEATSRQGRTQRLTGCFRFYQTTHWESFEQSPTAARPPGSNSAAKKNLINPIIDFPPSLQLFLHLESPVTTLTGSESGSRVNPITNRLPEPKPY